MGAHRLFLPRFLTAVLVGAALAAPAAPVEAQYFGRNKVQYETFDFRVMQTPHFDVYIYPEEEAAGRDAARMAERWYARLSRILDHQFEDRQPIVLYGSHPAFQQTTTLQGDIGEGTGGVTEAFKQRVIMPLAGSYQETDHVLGHELVHAFQYDISGLGRSRGSIGAGGRAFGSAPLWFTEGMAEYLSVGPVDPHTAMWLRDAVLTGNVPTVEQLTEDPRFFPYRWGQAFWAYVGGRWGDATIGQILRLLGQGVPYPEAFQRVLNIELDDLSEDWHVAIRRAYLPLLAERPEAREVARPLITPSKEGGRLNVGPSISPDGRFVAFLSELSRLDVELWLANARTGEVIRRLRRGTAFDPHFQSLRFLNSAGTWSPDSKQFAFSAQRGGRDVLVIIDVEDGDIVREVELEQVSEIVSPTWSPDGRTIVFSGIFGGISDLYAFDLGSAQTRRLTSDAYAELHPSFSPDGRTLAFVTDRGAGTDLAALRYEGYRIATMDAAGGAVQVLAISEAGSNINPQWSRDGRSLYFISNRSGIPNIYRAEVASGQLFQVTRLFGGVSGITDISPALTVARNDDRLLFTAYERNGYNIYALTTPQELAGTPATPETLAAGATPIPAQLPPVPRPTQAPFNRVSAYLADAQTGLPTAAQAAAWPLGGYRPRLGLDYLGQPQVGVAVGGLAGQGGLYGGISGIFSDILGYHTVFGTVAAQGQLDEFGFQTMYLNQKHRWNWGAVAQRVPYIALGQQFQLDGDVLRNQILRYRLFNSALQGVAQYPFSQVQRVEFSAGARRIAQDIQVIEVSGPAIIQGGQVVGYVPQEQRQYELEGASEAWNLVEASAALVYDNALFGYTSPFAGQRYRLELTPTTGTLSYTQALADYRRYLFFRPFTLAFQGMHFGRYGPDSGDRIFYPIFLGQPSLVRGYYSLYNECVNQPQSCNSSSLGQLFGNRIAVAKAELRFPLIRALVIGPVGFPPIEGFGFFDAGTAWEQGTRPTFQRGTPQASNERGLVTSAGVGARVNLLGYAILEINYVNAFERQRTDPQTGEPLGRTWRWQFAVQPGF